VRENRPVPLCWRISVQRQQSGKRHILDQHFRYTAEIHMMRRIFRVYPILLHFPFRLIICSPSKHTLFHQQIWKILNLYSHFTWKRLYILIAREKTLLFWTKKKLALYIISCCNNCYMAWFNFNITTFAQLNFTFFTNLRIIVTNRTLVGSVNDITPQTMIYLLHLYFVRVLIGDDAWHDLGDSIKSTWDLGTYGKSKIYVEEASVSLFV